MIGSRGVPQSIEALMREHRVIERVLGVLERYAARLEEGELLPRRDLGAIVDVLRDYADGLHHAKEERVLFPAMVAAGLSGDDGPLAFMLEQHEEGRRLVGDLAELAREEAWSEADRARTARVARDYVFMLRAHIRDEDDVVYPLAQSRVRPAAWDDVERATADLEASSAVAARALVALAEELVARYP